MSNDNFAAARQMLASRRAAQQAQATALKVAESSYFADQKYITDPTKNKRLMVRVMDAAQLDTFRREAPESGTLDYKALLVARCARDFADGTAWFGAARVLRAGVLGPIYRDGEAKAAIADVKKRLGEEVEDAYEVCLRANPTLGETRPPPTTARTKRRRRNSARRLTEKQIAIVERMAEEKGDAEKVAYSFGITRQAVEKQYKVANAKIAKGRGPMGAKKKPKQQRIPTDKRGQTTI